MVRNRVTPRTWTRLPSVAFGYVNLPTWMMEAQEAPWQNRDKIFLVADVVDIRDVGIDIICERLVANLWRSSSTTRSRWFIVDSYPWQAVANRLESNRRRQMQGEVNRVDQSECGTCALIVFSESASVGFRTAAHRGSDRRSSRGWHRTSRLRCSQRPKPGSRSYRGASSTAHRNT